MNTTSASMFDQSSGVQNYHDLNALQSIKYGPKNDEARLDAVAKQFESLFVSMMLKGMRSANKVFGEDNPLNSNEMQFYQEMYDSQLAVSLSSTRGIGIAEVVKRQLAGMYQSEPVQGEALPTRMAITDYERKDFGRQFSREQLSEAVAKIDAQLETTATTASPVMDARKVEEHMDFSNPESFISSLLPLAKQVEAETGIDARMMLAQSALETGWGRHQIMKDDGTPSFNLFGIKSHHAWTGEQADILTTEFRDGVAMKERASFRAYDSYADSFQDYAKFLQGNERYSGALAFREDPKEFAHALQDSGYATDPQYGNKIGRIIEQYLSEDELSGPKSSMSETLGILTGQE